jgi:hypothetical protein
MKNFIVIVLCFFVFHNHSLRAQWVHPNGPLSGTVTCFVVNGNNILAGLDQIGVYLSTDKGANWQLVNNGLTDLNIYKLAVCGSYYFVGTHAGVFRSSNNGTNWEPANNGLNNNTANSLAANNTNIFAGTGGGGVYLSTNNGTNWTPVNNGIPANAWVNGLAASGNNVYAGIPESPGGVYLSTNNGTNWTQIGLSGITVYNIAVFGNYIFACTPFNGVYFTTNGGNSWTPSGSFSFAVYNLKFGDSDLYAGTYGHGVYISKDNGSTWIQVGLNSSTIYSLASTDVDVFAGTSGDGIWTRPISEIKNISGVTIDLPSVFSLSQNYPNPFNPSTTINYSLSKAGNVKITLYNSLGSKVSDIVNEYKFAGNYSVKFNGSNLPSGMYLYKLESGNYAAAKKLILLK